MWLKQKGEGRQQCEREALGWEESWVKSAESAKRPTPLYVFPRATITKYHNWAP